MMPQQHKTCGTCFFGKVFVQDISKRMCHGAPPTAISVPGPGGQVGMRMARPVVSVSEDACALHRDKNAQDEARDDATARVLQSPEVSEVRQ